MGSTIIQAISEPPLGRRVSRLQGRCGNVRVCSVVDAGMPGEVGTPKVSAPDPVFTSSASAMITAFKLDGVSAGKAASQADSTHGGFCTWFTMRTISIDGTMSQMVLAISIQVRWGSKT